MTTETRSHAAVVVTLLMLGKEIVSYCLDPVMAQASGVRAGFVHYLLLMLVALMIVLGMRLMGGETDFLAEREEIGYAAHQAHAEDDH